MEEIVLNSTPADEVSTDTTPADEVSTDTTPADEVSTDTIPADEISTDTIPADEISTNTEQAAPVHLPADYLSQGYYAATPFGAKYLRHEFVGEYAEIMAALLADMKPSDFSALLRGLKSYKKSSWPYEARKVAVLELLPKALQLVSRHKAPPLLLTFIKANINHVHCDDDFAALLRHFEAISAYMTL